MSARDDRAAVDKAVSLLVALGDHRPSGTGVSELARRTGLSKSTAFRVLGVLERNAVVERVGTGYRLGTTMRHLGRAGQPAEYDHLRDLLLPFLADLYEMSHHTVHLGVLSGTEVVYLAKLYGHRSIPAPSRIGGRLPAHLTAIGKVLLAYDPEAARAAAARPLVAATPHSITDPGILTSQLAEIRRTGLSFDRQESRLGLSCVAAPVLGRNGTVVAAFSVSAPHRSVDPASFGPGLRRLGAAATRAITGRRPPVLPGNGDARHAAASRTSRPARRSTDRSAHEHPVRETAPA
ncbi:IclR family transcriptional regulator [Nocardia niwae]|uniref:IclR family transcriptional regulator n=1 Tax=Nocardia niwae TaxID=626084 RepID=UPI001FE197E4|nr:IclR family transcriptional regulator [Nocardia niwae]